MRAMNDAILTGIGTVLADNPLLTCRLPGREEDSPVRVVVDSNLRIPQDAGVLPAWIFTSEAALKKNKAVADSLTKKGSRIFTVVTENNRLSLMEVLKTLAQEGITRLMVEAGNALSTAFIEQKLADRIVWFRAPSIVGEKGLSALNTDHLAHYRLTKAQKIDNDVLEIYLREAV